MATVRGIQFGAAEGVSTRTELRIFPAGSDCHRDFDPAATMSAQQQTSDMTAPAISGKIKIVFLGEGRGVVCVCVCASSW